ncbi:MAG: hypothetical protein Q7W54_16665, partial [Bacteroidota bacterium]|nr:hypothetical protein [Bacteroidota bacterium]
RTFQGVAWSIQLKAAPTLALLKIFLPCCFGSRPVSRNCCPVGSGAAMLNEIAAMLEKMPVLLKILPSCWFWSHHAHPINTG